MYDYLNIIAYSDFFHHDELWTVLSIIIFKGKEFIVSVPTIPNLRSFHFQRSACKPEYLNGTLLPAGISLVKIVRLSYFHKVFSFIC